MTVLDSISGENFCQFEKFELSLAHLGLVWVGGLNRDTAAATSNGSGKSNLLKAIGWCLYGETVENEPADDVIREGEKSTCVTIKTKCGWEFSRERKRGSPKLTVKHHDAALVGSKADLQKKIIEVVGYDWSSFLNAVLYAQRDTKRFIHPKTSDAERKNIIHHIQGTEVVNDAYEWIRKEASKLRKQLDEQEREHATAAAIVSSIDIKRLEVRETEFEEERAEHLSSVRKKIGSLKARIREEAARQKALKVERKKWLSEKATLENKVSLLKKKRAELRTSEAAVSKASSLVTKQHAELDTKKDQIDERSERLKRLTDAGKCPVCESSFKDGDATQHLKQERAFIAELKKSLPKMEENLHELRIELQLSQKEADKLRVEIDESTCEDELAVINGKLSSKTGTMDLAKDLVRQAKERKEEAKNLEKAENPFVEELRAAKTKLALARKKLEAAKKKIDEISQELSLYEFWKRGFSPTGLPSYMLDEAMPLLTERANHYLETLADGDITINFSTQRELASSGETRDEIGIAWEIEGVQQKLPSGGQWRKMEIATDLAFIDLAGASESNSLDLLCLDEVLDGLDVIGRQRLTRLLHTMRSIRGTILVISHDSDISEIFERSITVVKEDGVARLEVR